MSDAYPGRSSEAVAANIAEVARHRGAIEAAFGEATEELKLLVTSYVALQINLDEIHNAAFEAGRRAGREDAAREIESELEEQQRRSAENSAKFVRAMSSPFADHQDDLPNIKTHGWELHGRIAALKHAAEVARGEFLPTPDESIKAEFQPTEEQPNG